MQPFSLLPAPGSDQTDEWIKLGTEAQLQGNFPKAETFYRSALRISPNNTIAIHNLAILQACTANLNDALLSMEKAVLFDDKEPVMYANQALICLESDRIDEGVDAATKAMTLAIDFPVPSTDPNADQLKTAGYVNARLAYAMVSASAGHPEQGYLPYMQMLKVDPKHPAAGPNSCFVTSLMPIGPKDLIEPRKQWYLTNRVQRPRWPHKNDRNPDRILRIGYVGGDFKSHSAAMMFSNVILNHDRSEVEVFLYSSLPTDPEKDDMSAWFRKASATWREISGKSDDDVEAMIEEDAIDILVDLAGHTNGGRLGVFCRKPAPIQVTAWGFAHGTGIPEIDVFFADPVAVPQEERQYFAERIYDLPCIVTYRPPTDYQIKPSSSAPYYQNDYITFGTFTRFEKLSDECLAAYREILLRVPDSKMLFKDHAYKRPYSIRRVLAAMKDIDPKRLMFAGSSSHPEHLLAYQTVDILLDTWPHGCGVVTLESLYSGVPILTRYGTQPSGRTAASVLTSIGRKDWIAKDDEHFVENVVAWANRPHELAKARKTLREEFVSSPVVFGYCSAVEKAYRTLWKEWCGK